MECIFVYDIVRYIKEHDFVLAFLFAIVCGLLGYLEYCYLFDVLLVMKV